MSEQYQDNWDAKPATDQEIARLRKIEKAARDLEKDLIDRAELRKLMANTFGASS